MGSGKSEAARFLESFGAFVIDTDLLAREAVAPSSDALREIGRAWPAVVRGGHLDRAGLAHIVFADPQARERLNAIVHPHVRRLAEERERFAKPGQTIVHVVPLLFETGYADRCDSTVLVVAPDDERRTRIRTRDRLTDEQIDERMNAQISPADASKLASHVIDNDGTLVQLRERTRSVYDLLL
ncbi:MAG: dephospho-CoA kinase [Candidatus Eremiobacteraeota bacterium]|nr:dephospho-CoA kinase [Candidatus Eremiobacteraeota bacterium]